MAIIQRYADNIRVEVEPAAADEERAGRLAGGTVEVTQSFAKGFAAVLPALKSVVEQLRTVTPDHIEVECGVKMTGEAGAVIARTGVEGNFRVTLKWERTDAQR